MAVRRTIALTYNDDFYLYRFKGGLLRALVAAGHTVYAIAPAGKSVAAIENEGATFIDWPLVRKGADPRSELRSLITLRSIYKRIRPDLVHHFTAKPNIYGAIAAGLASVPVVVASVNGLGYVFVGRDLKSTVIRPAVSLLYRLAFGLSEAVVFQNHDDSSFFLSKGLLSTAKVRHISGGSGVDTSYFSPKAVDQATRVRLKDSLQIPADSLVVIMVSRMLTHKGVVEFAECARALGRSRQAIFLLVGPVDDGNPASVSLEQLVEWEDEGWLRYLGERSDIRELLAVADVVALPSYREGFPRALLEAAAMARPMVATDVPGCREVVRHGVNGLLVPVRDAGALVSAVGELLKSPALRPRMGEAARQMALQEFDERSVVSNIMKLYEELLAGQHGA